MIARRNPHPSRSSAPPVLASVSRGRPTCTGDAQVLRGCAGPSRQKNCRFARKSGTPVSGCQETGQGVADCRDRGIELVRSLGMRTGTRRRFTPRRVALKRQPAPKSAPVSQDSKCRGGSPTSTRCGGLDVHRRERQIPFPLKYILYVSRQRPLCSINKKKETSENRSRKSTECGRCAIDRRRTVSYL